MDEAIDLAIEGRSLYPERAAFIDADTPSAGHDIERAADEGLSVVLVPADRQHSGSEAGTRSALIAVRACGSHLCSAEPLLRSAMGQLA